MWQEFFDAGDVAPGHWLAAVHGRIGERYILGNADINLGEFFETLATKTGPKPPKLQFPHIPVLLAAHIDEAFSKWVEPRYPRIPVAGVKMAGKICILNVQGLPGN